MLRVFEIRKIYNGGGGGGIIASAEDNSLVGGVWGCPPKENLEAPKCYFQHLS